MNDRELNAVEVKARAEAHAVVAQLAREVLADRKLAREVMALQEAALGEGATDDPVWQRAKKIAEGA